MQCPHCGYLLSPLDKDCARCRNLGIAPSPANPSVQNAPAGPQPPQTQVFYPSLTAPQTVPPVSSQPPAHTPLNSGYTPYMTPAPAPTVKSSSGERAGQIIGGVLGALMIVGYVGLRIWLIEARQQRKDAAMLDLNQHYNDTMRRQFDTMQMQHQIVSGQAMQDASSAGRPGILNTPSAYTPGQFGAQQRAFDDMQRMHQQSMDNMQRMQQQNLQNMQQMRDHMMQNRPGMGGRF